MSGIPARLTETRPHSSDGHRFTTAARWLLLLVFGVFLGVWILRTPHPSSGVSWSGMCWAVAVGMLAQLVDVSLGMGYGIISSSALLSLGYNPALSTASIHVAEIFASGASAIAHWERGNIRRDFLGRLVFPGILGALAGTLVVVHVDGEAMRPWIAAYLLVVGGRVMWRAFQAETAEPGVERGLRVLSLTGGFVDTVGGGGWGPIVTTKLVDAGLSPRVAVGTSNAAEFFITLASGGCFSILMAATEWEVLAGLVTGGWLVAPIGAYLADRLPRRMAQVLVGGCVCTLAALALAKGLR